VTGDFKMGLSSGVILRLVIITLVCVIASTLFAIFAYKKEIFKPSIEESKIYKLLKNQYYIPQFYERVFIRGYEKISEICFKADKKVIDNSVDAIAKGLVKLGSNADKMQSGNLSLMLRLMVGGFIALLVLAVILGGK